jgi:hypothetical protein
MPLDKCRLETAHGRVARDARSDNAAANDQDVPWRRFQIPQ